MAWFGALWASGVLGMGCVASLLRWVLSSRFLGLTPAGTGKASPKPVSR